MIQRIQSVYLAVGAIAAAAPLYIRYWISESSGGSPVTDVGLQVLAGITTIVAVAAIFFFNDRKLQFKLTLFAQILTLLLIVGVISVLYLQGIFPGTKDNQYSPGSLGLVVLPFVGYVLFLLARRAINKDIKLVKSMDRLR